MSDKVRFRSPVDAAGFTILPNLVLHSPRLCPGAKLAYALLRHYAWQDGSCFPGQERLAAQVPCSRRALISYLHELQALGLITIQRRGRTRTNVYLLESLDSLPVFAALSGPSASAPLPVEESEATALAEE
jgi:hypothetical protein